MENKAKVGSEIKESNYTGFTKVDAPVIHTMPRRFINAKVEGDGGHKGMGLLIFGIGLITLIAGAVFVYFYVFNPKLFTTTALNDIQNNPVKIENKDDGATKKSVDLEANSSEEESIENIKTVESDLETNDIVVAEEIIATSSETEEISSSSDNIKFEIKQKETEKKQYFPAPDADVDGLSDAEELIFGVNKNIADSDGDGYSDLAELKNFYNPAGDGKLIVNSGIKKYSNLDLAYTLYYPKNWEVSDSASNGGVIFKIDNLQFVQVIATENSDKKSVDEWYMEQYQQDSIKSEQKFYKPGWESIKSDDGLIYYLQKPNHPYIYIINYNVGADSVLYYSNIFLLMINSFEL